MNNKEYLSPQLQFIIGAACIVIIIAGLKQAAPILNIIFLAWLLAQSVSPLPNWLMRKHFPPVLAVLITLLLVVVGGTALVSLLGASIANLIQTLPTYQSGLIKIQKGFEALLAAWGFELSKLKILDLVSPARIMTFVSSLLGALASTLGQAFALIFIVAVLLLEFAVLQKPSADEAETRQSLVAQFLEDTMDVRKYIAITGMIGLVTASFVTILLLLLGVDFAVTWGVLSFFLNFIPGVGDLIAWIPPAIIALLEHGWPRALMVILGMFLINFAMDKIVKPKFIKKSLDVSFLLVILSLIFWSWTLGPAGAFLAVPLTITVKKMMLRYPQVAHQPVMDKLEEKKSGIQQDEN